MKTIWNRTHKPLRITLHMGHILHLGPDQTAHVADHDADRPALRRLIASRDVVLVDEAAAGEARTVPKSAREARPDVARRRVVIPIGGRTAGGRRER